jgi:hypothetical protein
LSSSGVAPPEFASVSQEAYLECEQKENSLMPVLKRLSPDQRSDFERIGYLHKLPPVFSGAEMKNLNSGLN